MVNTTDKFSKGFFSLNLICTKTCMVVSILTSWVSLLWTAFMIHSGNIGTLRAFLPEMILAVLYLIWIPSNYISASALENGQARHREILLTGLSFATAVFVLGVYGYVAVTTIY